MQQQNKGNPNEHTAIAEMIELQRRIFERQRRHIEAREDAPSPGFTRYRREYRQAVSSYLKESGFGTLCDAVANAKIAYIADYHTLPLAQRTFIKLISGILPQVDNICLALEFVQEEYQDDLVKYLRHQIQESTFLRRIHYKEHWPYDIWPNFKPIFELASDQGFPVIAIDNNASMSLAKRDHRAATRIVDATLRHPEATILVFCGQMHLAPAHLPAAVDREFAKREQSPPERVIVYQNPEEIYWQLASIGREEVEVVQVDHESYAVNNTPPLVQQLSYLHWIHFDEELLDYAGLDNTVRSLIRNLARFLRIDVTKRIDKLRVMTPGDLDLMDTLDQSDLDAHEIRTIIEQVAAQESACVCDLELIYLATLSINHAAEEAAHYIKGIASCCKSPRGIKDRFYYTVINEACGFFGSKVINPKRKTDHIGRLRKIVATARGRKGRMQAEEKAAEFALRHLEWERGHRARPGTAAALNNPKVFNAAAHMLGYILGDRLYYALTDGEIDKKTIRRLFLQPLDGENEALHAYLDLSARLRNVKIPRRI